MIINILYRYISGLPLPTNPSSRATHIRHINQCWNWGLKNELITFENDKKKIEKAITYYKVLSETNTTSFLELKPVTGRKHQLRKQLALIDNPIVGDKKYILSNKKIKSDKDLMLHAYSLKFYINNKKFFYKANPPAAFNKYLNKKKLNILNF